jgi:hypothetical protein
MFLECGSLQPDEQGNRAMLPDRLRKAFVVVALALDREQNVKGHDRIAEIFQPLKHAAVNGSRQRARSPDPAEVFAGAGRQAGEQVFSVSRRIVAKLTEPIDRLAVDRDDDGVLGRRNRAAKPVENAETVTVVETMCGRRERDDTRKHSHCQAESERWEQPRLHRRSAFQRLSLTGSAAADQGNARAGHSS